MPVSRPEVNATSTITSSVEKCKSVDSFSTVATAPGLIEHRLERENPEDQENKFI